MKTRLITQWAFFINLVRRKEGGEQEPIGADSGFDPQVTEDAGRPS